MALGNDYQIGIKTAYGSRNNFDDSRVEKKDKPQNSLSTLIASSLNGFLSVSPILVLDEGFEK